MQRYNVASTSISRFSRFTSALTKLFRRFFALKQTPSDILRCALENEIFVLGLVAKQSVCVYRTLCKHMAFILRPINVDATYWRGMDVDTTLFTHNGRVFTELSKRKDKLGAALPNRSCHVRHLFISQHRPEGCKTETRNCYKSISLV